MIRRPGCPFCREEAHILDEHRDIIEKEMVCDVTLCKNPRCHRRPLLPNFVTNPYAFFTTQGFRMVVVLHEKLGAATFKNDYWNGGETYWDASKGFYKALG